MESSLANSFNDNLHFTFHINIFIWFVSGIPPGVNLSLESLVLIFWPTTTTSISKTQSKDIQIYCADAALVILHMIRKMVNEVNHMAFILSFFFMAFISSVVPSLSSSLSCSFAYSLMSYIHCLFIQYLVFDALCSMSFTICLMPYVL